MVALRSLVRIAVNVVVDGSLAALAVPAARLIAAPGGDILHPWWSVLVGAASLLLAGVPFGLSQQFWRFAGIGDIAALAASSALASVVFAVIAHLAGAGSPNPAFPVVLALTLFALLGGSRLAYRWMRTKDHRRDAGIDAASVLLIGETEDVDLFLRAMTRDHLHAYKVEGLVSSSPRQAGRRIHGHQILGAVADIATVLEKLREDGRLPGTLVITTPDLPGPRMALVVAQADRYGLRVRRAPRPTSLDENADDRRDGVDLRPVAIEDLLNRPQVPLDRDGMARLIQGRRVVVTGAGGTIGSELVRQVAAFGPAELILIDNGEYALWQIDLELAENHPHVRRHAFVIDIRDEVRVQGVFQEWRPELVFHAAALKHVPIVEANPLEGIMTNAVGTRNIADAARAHGAVAMVLISTDKAVNPTSVMGASKRLAEMYCQALDNAARATGTGMRCITVRFGNVLGSTGSVVPLFQRQLAKGGPLTVTHPDMQRYFMTVREAVGLVLQASVVGVAPVSKLEPVDGGIFVLDMGEPVKIVDLARQMIRLAGLRPEEDIEIRFTGLRPGEKLYEELFHGTEPPKPTEYPGLLMASPRTADPAIVGRALDEVAAACRNGQEGGALAVLNRLVPEFERVLPSHDTGHARA